MSLDNNDDFRPDDFHLEDVDKKQVRLVWRQDSGGRQAEVLHKNQLSAVLLELQKQIEPNSAVPINPASLRAGTLVAISGLGFGPRQDHFLLTVFSDLPEQDRGVTIPLRFSKKDAAECVEAMTKWLGDQK